MNKLPIFLKGISKRFRSGPEIITILDQLDLSVGAGESVAITGPSGSGKTTLLNIIGGLDDADEGSVLLEGTDLTDLDETARARIRGRTVGFVFQFHYLLRDFSAIENVMLPAYMAGTSRRKAVSTAKELLIRVGLDGRLDHYPHQLSGGERQRVAIARALVNDPPIILADEPTGNLDPAHSTEVQELIFSMSGALGKTLVLVSHDHEVAQRAERHLVLEHGILENA